MNIRMINPGDAPGVRRLFEDTFPAGEAALVAELAHDLAQQADGSTITGIVAEDDQSIVACAVFSRMTYAQGTAVFILSPMAVHPSLQGQGIGQNVIRQGIDALIAAGGEVLVTYGDPAFYSKVGFELTTTDCLPAPFELSHPEGWIAQSLTGETLPVLTGPVGCVGPLDKAELW